MPTNKTYRDKLNDPSKFKEAVVFPFKISENGSLNTFKDSIKYHEQNLKNYLVTAFGSRIMKPALGSPIQSLIGTLISEDGISNAKNIIEHGISTQFPKLNLLKIDVIPRDNDLFSIEIMAEYTEQNKNKFKNGIINNEVHTYNIINVSVDIQ